MARIRRALVPLALTALLASTLAPAAASDTDTSEASVLDAKDRAHMRAFWDANDVSPDVQNRLLDGIEEGKWPQADMGEVEPVSTRTLQRNGNRETIAVYPDGSIAVSAVQQRSGTFNPQSFGVDSVDELHKVYGIAPMAIGGCRYTSGSGYSTATDCSVYGSTATVAAGFRASYTIVQGRNNDRILRHSGPYQQCAGAVCDTPYLALEYLNEQSGRKAQVEYYFRWTAVGGVSSTGRVALYVGGDKATSAFAAKF